MLALLEHNYVAAAGNTVITASTAVSADTTGITPVTIQRALMSATSTSEWGGGVIYYMNLL
jgi:hypothetical protein